MREPKLDNKVRDFKSNCSFYRSCKNILNIKFLNYVYNINYIKREKLLFFIHRVRTVISTLLNLFYQICLLIFVKTFTPSLKINYIIQIYSL